MKKRIKEIATGSITGLMICLLISACKKDSSDNDPTIFSANGDITAKMIQFRNQLGNLNSTPGATSGRREINWDGVPDSMDGKKLPNDFFNPVGVDAPQSLQRGIIYDGLDNAMVSKTNFSEINTNAASSFTAFSGNKNFAVVNANNWPVTFQLAGQRVDASVQAFGAVFSDVDKDNSTFIEFYNSNTSLGRYYVPAHDNTTSFSFLGVYFPNKTVTQIVVGHEGKLIDGEKDITQGGSKDLVVLDDFIYSEPLHR
jgi:hypothetical protein